ncbi:MAG: hypothetical protein M3R45_15840 [Pseudomonadota bacterium]|nr:hypothetical protein [Pseudomonadota bacterium]
MRKPPARALKQATKKRLIQAPPDFVRKIFHQFHELLFLLQKPGGIAV